MTYYFIVSTMYSLINYDNNINLCLFWFLCLKMQKTINLIFIVLYHYCQAFHERDESEQILASNVTIHVILVVHCFLVALIFLTNLLPQVLYQHWVLLQVFSWCHRCWGSSLCRCGHRITSIIVFLSIIVITTIIIIATLHCEHCCQCSNLLHSQL